MMAAEEIEIFPALGWHVPKFAGPRTEVAMTVIFVRYALFLNVPKQFQTALTKNRRICDVNTRFIRRVTNGIGNPIRRSVTEPITLFDI